MDLNTLTAPALAACCPITFQSGCSALDLLQVAPDSNHGHIEIERALHSGEARALTCRLSPLPHRPEPFGARVNAIPWRFTIVSWSNDAPTLLYVRALRFPNIGTAQDHALLNIGLEEGHRAFTAEFLSNEIPQLTPV